MESFIERLQMPVIDVTSSGEPSFRNLHDRSS